MVNNAINNIQIVSAWWIRESKIDCAVTCNIYFKSWMESLNLISESMEETPYW